MSLKKYRISGELSHDGIQNIIRELEHYKNVILIQKRDLFLKLLSDEGIRVATEESNGDSHGFSKMVFFYAKKDGDKTFVIGENGKVEVDEIWYSQEADGTITKHDDTGLVSPILMLEYGSAGRAVKWGANNRIAVRGHENDERWSYATKVYTDENGKQHLAGWKQATAAEPKEPMYKASMQMYKDVLKIARKAFGN